RSGTRRSGSRSASAGTRRQVRIRRCSRRSSPKHGSTAQRGRTVQVVNPATEQPIVELESAGLRETDAAVAAAAAAFPAWRAISPADRGRLLRRLASLVEEHTEELALAET